MTIINLDHISQVTEREIKGTSEFGPYRGKALTLTDDFGHVFQVSIFYSSDFKEGK